MTIIHFDYRPTLDSTFQKQWHIYTENPLNSQTAAYDDSIKQISVFISSKVTADVIDQFPNLQTIMCRSAWTDHVDVAYAESKWIAVHRVPWYGPHVIATHAIALFLQWNRQLIPSTNNTQHGNYSFVLSTIKDTHNLIIWLIGTWKIGLEIIKLLKALWCRVVAYDLYPNHNASSELWFEYVDFDTVISHDALFLACNASKENENLINWDVISQIKAWAILINIARGSLIDEDALIQHITKFLYVWLDAIKDESPEGLAKFAPFDNIVITPHIAYLADSTVKTIWDETYKALL